LIDTSYLDFNIATGPFEAKTHEVAYMSTSLIYETIQFLIHNTLINSTDTNNKDIDALIEASLTGQSPGNASLRPNH
jgi:hypothetical protein